MEQQEDQQRSVGKKGYQPLDPIEPGPLFAWPPEPRAALRWAFGFPGYIWPFNLVYFGIGLATWLWLHPPLEDMQTIEVGWVATLMVRNVALMTIVYSSWHVWFYRWRKQEDRLKYNRRWLSTTNKSFLFKNQLWDNVFWSVCSGVTVWTAYEVVYFWAAANGNVPVLDFAENPMLSVLLLLAIPLWRLVHFYVAHRLLHADFLYKPVHSLHHKNVNVGPWSGMAMHPVEHVLYMSCVLIHFVVPSHPLHFIFNAQHAALSPAQSHSGFDQIEFGERRLATGGYFHQLHHTYFECNYGDNAVPADRWFGTYHDGTDEAHVAMRERRRAAGQRRQK